MTEGPEATAGSASGRDTRLVQLITTIFGMCARAEGNWLSIAAVVAMMSDLGADAQAVRSSISRLKRRGVLCSERRGGAAGYRLAEDVLEVLAEGDVRIFGRARATEGDGWVVVIFSVPESERDKRHALRSALTRLGFGTAAPGVWIAPGIVAGEASRTMRRLGLSDYVDIFTGQHVAFGDLRAKVSTWWDLDELTELYSEFLLAYRPALYSATTGELSPQQAFRIYVPMLTQWRRLPYRDPGIPLTLLPPAWKGEAAAMLFGQLEDALRVPAQRHTLEVIHEAASRTR
ncbi:PaaX family transcriptional regulator C-terminal domain-containing protein [Nocardia beijingensis]|uniref:PaaX family transcriptional regulator n=1 Tax=Nocardia beijingensis TaxID=95162 RepID=UPI0033C69FB4